MSIASFGKETLAYGLGGAALRLMSILLLPIYTAYLAPSEYGVVAMLATMTAVLQPMFSLGCGVSMGPLYFEADTAKDKSEVVWSTIVLHAFAAGLLILFAFTSGTTLGPLLRVGEDQVLAVRLAVVNCIIAIFASDMQLWLQFERRLLPFFVATVGGSIVGGVFSVVALAVFDLGVLGVVLGQVVANLIVLMVAMLSFLKFGHGSASLALCRRLLKTGIPLIPSFAFLFVLTQSNRYILEEFDGLAAVGVYSIGFSVGGVIGIVVSAVTTAWYPFFMRFMKKPEDAELIFGKIATYYVLILGFCCVLIGLFADKVIALAVHGDFEDAATVVASVALALTIQGLFNLMLPGLYFKHEVHYVAIIQGIAALLSVPVNYVLIKNWGLAGAGYGVLAGNVLLVLLMFLWTRLRASEYPKIRYEWGRLSRGALMLLFVYILHQGLAQVWHASSWLQSTIMALVAFCVLLFQLDAGERLAIKKWMGLL